MSFQWRENYQHYPEGIDMYATEGNGNNWYFWTISLVVRRLRPCEIEANGSKSCGQGLETSVPPNRATRNGEIVNGGCHFKCRGNGADLLGSVDL